MAGRGRQVTILLMGICIVLLAGLFGIYSCISKAEIRIKALEDVVEALFKYHRLSIHVDDRGVTVYREG